MITNIWVSFYEFKFLKTHIIFSKYNSILNIANGKANCSKKLSTELHYPQK